MECACGVCLWSVPVECVYGECLWSALIECAYGVCLWSVFTASACGVCLGSVPIQIDDALQTSVGNVPVYGHCRRRYSV